jgi:hypothetical protein
MDWWERVPPFNVMGTPTSKIQTKREWILTKTSQKIKFFLYFLFFTDLLIDIDESSIVLATANRNFGHVPIGHRARVLVPAPRGTKYTLILAISPFIGVVTALVTKENTYAEVFERFLRNYLIPKIKPGTKKIINQKWLSFSILFVSFV